MRKAPKAESTEYQMMRLRREQGKARQTVDKTQLENISDEAKCKH